MTPRRVGNKCNASILALQKQIQKDLGIKIPYSQASDAYATVNEKGKAEIKVYRKKTKVIIER